MNRFCQNICWHLSNTFRGVFCKEQIIEHTSMVCLLHFEEDKSLAQFPHLFRNTYFLYKTQNLQIQNENYNYNNTIQRGITLNIIKSSHPFLCWIWNLVRKRHCTNLTTIELQLTILTMIFKVLSTITNSNGFRVLLWIYNLNIIWNECCTCKEIDRQYKTNIHCQTLTFIVRMNNKRIIMPHRFYADTHNSLGEFVLFSDIKDKMVTYTFSLIISEIKQYI